MGLSRSCVWQGSAWTEARCGFPARRGFSFRFSFSPWPGGITAQSTPSHFVSPRTTRPREKERATRRLRAAISAATTTATATATRRLPLRSRPSPPPTTFSPVRPLRFSSSHLVARVFLVGDEFLEKEAENGYDCEVGEEHPALLWPYLDRVHGSGKIK
jgi:hypothetical protein